MDYTKFTDAQLLDMNLEELTAYSQTVSTSVGLQYSSIAGDQVVQSQYEYMILTSQSTINGLGYEITENDNAIIAADLRFSQLDADNKLLDSTMTSYLSSIALQDKIIAESDTAISSLILESAKIDAELLKSDQEFVSSATGYSTLYMDFMAKDILYTNCLTEISTTSFLYEAATIFENIALLNLQESTANVVARSMELSSLYLEGNDIQSTLSQYVIDETLATAALTSTNAGIIAISSLYATALVNQQYYQLVSTQTATIDAFTAAQSTLATTKMRAAANPTDTVLAAAVTMSQQRLTTLATTKSEVATKVTALQALVAGATSDSYDTTMAAAQAAVELENNNVSTFQGYADAATQEIKYYSSIFEQATNDIASSLAAVTAYSSFYNSSIAGSNALMDLVTQDTSSIAGQQAESDAISLTISSLNTQFDQHTSSLNGWISYSTLMRQELDAADAELSQQSTFFESTNKAILSFADTLQQVQSSITGNDTTIFTLSSILESETINMLGYQTDVAASFNLEELSAYQYRETYVRLRRVEAQKYYDACVLQQVQNTSTQNATLRQQAGTATFTPVAINLNTPTINLAYTNLTTITSFLDTFSNIYTNYDIQKVNLQGVSTSVGNQRTAYSTTTFFLNMSRLNPTNTNIGQSFSNAQAAFIANQTTTTNLMKNVALTQSQINTAKNTFLTTYQGVFVSNDITNNESTISSFLIAGFKAAVTL